METFTLDSLVMQKTPERLAVQGISVGQRVYTDGEILSASPERMNLLPNTEFEIIGTGYAIPKRTPTGDGSNGTLSITGNTTTPLTNDLIITLTSDISLTGKLVEGDLVQFGTGANAALTQSSNLEEGANACSKRVLSIVDNTHFTIGLNHFAINSSGNKVSVTSGSYTATPITRGNLSTTETVGNTIYFPSHFTSLHNLDTSLGFGHDHWWRTPQLVYWRDTWAANKKEGSHYSLGLMKTDGYDSFYWTEFTNKNLYFHGDVEKLRGKTVVFGSWCKQTKIVRTGAYWVLFIQSFNATGTVLATDFSKYPASPLNVWQWRELSVAIPDEAVRVKVGYGFSGNAGECFVLTQPMLTYGTRIGAGGYTRSFSTHFQGIRGFVPCTAWGTTINFPNYLDGIPELGTYGFTCRMDADTNAAIARTVTGMYCLLECQMRSNQGAVLVGFGLRTNEWRPTEFLGASIYNTPAANQWSEFRSYAYNVLFLDGNFYCYTGTAPVIQAQGVSIDISVLMLG